MQAQTHFDQHLTVARVAQKTQASTASHQEYLPFTVKVVQGEAALRKAVQVRHVAYSRHLEPHIVAALKEPEAMDREPGTVVLLAESKLDGSPLGSMRIQTNLFGPLHLEESVTLPQWMKGVRLAETSRLGVTQDKTGNLVKTVLVKAGYMYCLLHGIKFMLITARSPVDRQYQRLLFQDIYPDAGFIPLEHVFNLPHRVMYFDVFRGDEIWSQAQHPLLGFMRHTRHPDIQLSHPAFETPRL